MNGHEKVLVALALFVALGTVLLCVAVSLVGVS